MKRSVTLALAVLLAAVTLARTAQQSHPEAQRESTKRKLLGRIVLYDWIQHEMTSGDDFVVEVTSAAGKEHTQYVRVIYKPLWGGWDAPPPSPKDVLDRWAFVGVGPTWALLVHTPQTAEQKQACAEPVRNHRYEEETGTVEVPRFVATPGASPVDIPPVQSLPCFILNHGGLARAQ